MSEKAKRIIMTICGVLISGFSVGMFNFSNFGMDPFQVFTHGIWMHTSIRYGTFYSLLNLIMLVLIFIIDKSKIGLGTVINIFLLGYVVEFSSWLFERIIPNPTLAIRIIFLIIGIVVLCFGTSLYFTGDLGVSTYDAVALIISEKKIAPFQFARIGSDMICTIIGGLLGATIGVGTIVTAFFMGPIIEFFNIRISRPLRYGKNNNI